MNGGLSIIGYEIQIDDGNLGPFTTIQGGVGQRTISTKAVINTPLIISRTYRVRYAAVNVIGTSSWSPIASAIIADVPTTPSQPVITYVDHTKITVQWF